MALKSKIKWVALAGFALSLLSLATHILLARFFAKNEVRISPQEIQAFMGWSNPVENPNFGKVWSRVKSLQSLRPYSEPRTAYPGPPEYTNGFLFAHIEGEFHEIKTSICDLVVVARLLNATLILPFLQEVASAKGISSKFKGFEYIFDENHFITSLKRDVLVVKTLPKKYMALNKQKATFIKPDLTSTPEFYMKEVLPILNKKKAISLMVSKGGCLKNILPTRYAEYQRLRCRVAYEALLFRKEVQELGFRMVQRLQALGQPYLAYHTGLERDTLAFHGCAERFQDLHTQLIQYRRAQMIEEGHVKGNQSVDSEVQWRNGSCPIMPEDVGTLLRALGYGPHTRIYISGAELFGGQRVLIPLRAMFNNLEDRTTLTTVEERMAIYGPEEVLPSPPPPPPPPSADDVEKMLAAWQVAGPRPRPLPPPPSRNIYVHELEGWWSWLAVSDKEPPPSLEDLRLKGHKLLWSALDYIVCLHSTAFFPGFDRDRNGRPNFASLVMGHRAYLSPSQRTYHVDRKSIVKLIEEAGDSIFHPKHSWVLSVQNNLKATLDFTRLQESLSKSRENMFLSHPFPECSCRISMTTGSANNSLVTKQGVKRSTHDAEDGCPNWMETDISKDLIENDEMEATASDQFQVIDEAVGEGPSAAQVAKVEKEDNQTDAQEDDIDAND